MAGVIRISGRSVSVEVLKRITERSQGPDTPSRTEVVKQFCRSIRWQDQRGRWCLSSARIALQRLEEQGLVQLPPQTRRTPTSHRRQLLDDGQGLPALPHLPSRGGAIAGLRLRLIQDQKDPAHLIWNRLITREHPLKGAPLVGAQLRYLIECDAGIIGCFGLGPAAYHLICRDQWVGWSLRAREQNRTQVIGLSRFLIRSGLRVPNLASQCYSVLAKQVAKDWQERYQIKPLLMETYVDRLHHTGISLSAANWRRLGQSKGRGRDDRKRQGSKSLKDVWVYELHPRARELLQRCSAAALAPRSVFSGLNKDGLVQEMAGVRLGDKRLDERAQLILQQRWARPAHSYYRSFDSAQHAKRAYQLLESDRAQITLAQLLAPHQEQTARRMAAEDVVFLAQDTTGLSYNTLQKTQGLGTIGQDRSRGLFLHTLLAFRMDAISLGNLWAETWARPEQSDTPQRNDQSVDKKESGRWIRAFQVSCQWAPRMPQTQVIVCGDRESDIYELYDQKQAAPKNVHLLVRGQHDRCLADGTQLRLALEQLEPGGNMTVKIPRRQGYPERTAMLELRWKKVEFKPPAVALKKSWPTIEIFALLICEKSPPKGVEPIDWLLLTTWPIATLKTAQRLVKWYGLRWGIECWHKVLKEGCKVERRQMKTAQALERALAFDIIIACRVMLLSRLGKTMPDLPAEAVYSREELTVLEIKKKRPENTQPALD